MQVGRMCTHEVAVVDGNTTVLDAARRMREEHVGDLVVLERQDGREVPVGIVTDRDIVVGIVARGIEGFDKLLVQDLLVRPVVTARMDEDSVEVARRMQENDVRRVPVVDARGALVGIVSVDDLIGLLKAELDEVARLVCHQHQHEVFTRP